MKTEWEIKLLASRDLDADRLCQVVGQQGFEIVASGEGRQIDTYLDSWRMDLCRGGYGLRLREKEVSPAETARKVTLKTAGQRKGAVHTRVEIDATWDRAGLPRAARALPEDLRREVEPWTYSRSLKEVARIENWRRAFQLRHLESGATAEMAVDRVSTRAGRGGEGRFDEVEVESLEGGTECWQPLARILKTEFGLTTSSLNKLQRALEVGGVERPEPFTREVLNKQMPFAEAAFAIFRKHFQRLQENEAGTRLSEDIEALHDMRVSSRRLRAAFRLLSGAFSPGQLDLSEALMRETGQALGHARDLDVFLEEYPQLRLEVPAQMADDLAPFEKLIEGYRRKEQVRILRWMQAPKRLRAYEVFEEFLESGPTEQNPLGISTGQIAPGLILGVARRVYRQGGKIKRSSPAERLHRLRISMKKLRYAMEDFSDLYGEDLEDYVRQCKQLQDVLGAFNDATVLSEWLTQFIEEHGAQLPRRTVLAVGALVGALHARGGEARAGFRKAWSRFSRPSVREELNHALMQAL